MREKRIHPPQQEKRNNTQNQSVRTGFDISAVSDMCHTFFRAQEHPEEKKMCSNNPQKKLLQWVKSYTQPQLCTSGDWIISFYAYDPAYGKLRRKRIRVSPKFDKVKDRKRYAYDMIERITQQLQQGWNPWISFASEQNYATWQDACRAYRKYLQRMAEEKMLRDKTLYGYLRMLDMFNSWNTGQASPIYYAYQFDYRILARFTDWLWIDRKLSVTTRDNYVTWLKLIGEFLRDKNFCSDNPADRLKLMGKKVKCDKNRTVIPKDQMIRLSRWCADNNRYYQLACYILYYCFVRPREMSCIQVHHLNIYKGTLFIPGVNSKNGKDGTVTLPDKVIKLMLDLDVFSAPGDYYLFSKDMRPGKEYVRPKQFSDYWMSRIRPQLNFPEEWKFYSLKDTGITDLIQDNTDLLSVRNQARHHSLLMTDIYTPHDIAEANEEIRHRDTYF